MKVLIIGGGPSGIHAKTDGYDKIIVVDVRLGAYRGRAHYCTSHEHDHTIKNIFSKKTFEGTVLVTRPNCHKTTKDLAKWMRLGFLAYDNLPIMAVNNVGLYSIIFAWDYLHADQIDLIGFEHKGVDYYGDYVDYVPMIKQFYQFKEKYKPNIKNLTPDTMIM